MNPDPLDHLLHEYGKQPPPPPRTAAHVAIWSRIETERQRSSWARYFPLVGWREMFAEPRLAAAGLAIALLTGVVPVAGAKVFAQTPQRARDSLHLDVFTTCPSCMPIHGALAKSGR